MASICPPAFSSPSSTRSDPNPYKFTLQNPILSSRSRRSPPSTLHFCSLSRVSDSTICRCNGSSSDFSSPSDNSSVNRRWDSAIHEVLRNAIKRFDDYVNSCLNRSKGGDVKSIDVVERGSEVDDGEDWDWDRWWKHFSEIDEQERIVSILKNVPDSEQTMISLGKSSRNRNLERTRRSYECRVSCG